MSFLRYIPPRPKQSMKISDLMKAKGLTAIPIKPGAVFERYESRVSKDSYKARVATPPPAAPPPKPPRRGVLFTPEQIQQVRTELLNSPPGKSTITRTAMCDMLSEMHRLTVEYLHG